MALENYVFISYSRKDSEIVDKLTNLLQQNGIRVWRDLVEIAAGKNWAKEIEKGLHGASALIYVASEHSINSSWMTLEFQAFLNNEKPIIPVITDDVSIEQLPMPLKAYQWIDIREGLESSVEKIVNALKNKLPVGNPVQTKKKQSKGYVFISYTETDFDFVEELKHFMQDHGYAYWDYSESDRDYHSQLFLELEGVIIESVATLSILSEAWKKSEWTVKEYIFSQEIGIPVFLLRAKKISPTLVIAGIPYIDFTKDKEAGYLKLDKELTRKRL